MKSTYYILVLICLAFGAAVILYRNHKKKRTISATEDYLPINQINKTAKNDKKLTLKERIELSWKFLYDITELIINKFSREDADQVKTLGHILIDSGMRYEHVVDLGIKQNIVQAQNIEQAQTQQTQGQRSV